MTRPACPVRARVSSLRFVLTCSVVALPVLFAVTSARAQCWEVPPGHGPGGGCVLLSDYASTTWTLDGVSTFVVSNDCGVQAWTGGQWTIFGGLPAGTITSLAAYNGQLYAGGTFSKIGSDVVYNLARWDGSHWVQVGDGFTGGGDPRNPKGIVNAMMVINGVLYIGGSFVPVDTGTWTSWATWDGATLTPGLATQAVISGFTLLNGQLYASTTASVPGVWRYDTNVWTRIGTLADKSILAIANYNGTLVVGGLFTHFFTGASIIGVAQWGGSAWQPMGAGVGPPGSQVNALAIYNGRLFAAGIFSTMDNQTVNNIAAWDGTSWSSVGGGVQLYSDLSGVLSLGSFAGELDALGWMIRAGQYPDTSIARWNGFSWLPFVGGINGSVRAILPRGTFMNLGGDFTCIVPGGQTANYVMSADTSTTGALTDLHGFSGPNGPVYSLALLPNRIPAVPPLLIVGGSFTAVEGVGAPNVGQFGNGTWAPMSGGLNGQVSALQYYGSAMYAAGHFTASGATALPHLAKYTGAWVDPGAGAFGPLDAMTVSGSQLIIGGVPGGDGVSAWNGTTLTPYGAADGRVYALTTFNGDIIAGGIFTTIGGTTALGVARRDAASGQWFPMGPGFNAYVFALAVHDNHLYAGGSFTSSGGATVRRIAEWSGSSWVEVGGGLDNPVYALASWNGLLQVGGAFNQSLTSVLSPFWIEHISSGCDVVRVAAPVRPGLLSLGVSHPNPARGRAEVNVSLERAGPARILVMDLEGRRVRTLEDGWLPAGDRTVSWDGTNSRGQPCGDGVYFLVLEADGRTISTPMVRLR